MSEILDDLLKTVDEFQKRRDELEKEEIKLFGRPAKDSMVIIPARRVEGKPIPFNEHFAKVVEMFSQFDCEIQLNEYVPPVDKEGREIVLSAEKPDKIIERWDNKKLVLPSTVYELNYRGKHRFRF